ncbi:neural cell adhesion molecule 1 [Centropristis striata]|uniref:neural cell adhesion molecule 1 n=1 Tax=Centropristis striata TaxID=184440 RepID=UPI0027E07130|nr:neural cell adhesion molecule 1 [Centropristis striata]
MTNPSALILKIALLLLPLQGTDAEPEILISKQDIHLGEEIVMLCKVGEEGEIAWHLNGEEIDPDRVEKIDELSSKLTVKKATMQDAGRYTCHCEYDNGHTEEKGLQLYVHEGPSFGSTKVYHEFLEGKDSVVPCLVSGRPAVDVHWLRDKEEIPSNAGMRVRQLPDNSLLIEKVRREDAGTYVCQGQIRGRQVYAPLSVSVVVNAPPTVRIREEVKKVLAGPEMNVSLLCLVSGQPKPNISWTMPQPFDPSRHEFNSDSSQLTIRSVARNDFGEYICTATNKISESSATIMLHVYEAPEVIVSAEQQSVSVGESVSVSCNVSGHPQPEMHWLNKHTGHTVDSTTDRVRAVNGALVIDAVVPSDGGVYSCMAISTSGNASRDVAIYTQPGLPQCLSGSPGPSSVHFSFRHSPISGGTPITNFVLQWRQSAVEQWKEITVPVSGPLVIDNLRPYTWYTVRMAAMNAVGVGQFSEANTVRTQGSREPDSPVLSTDEKKIEGNSFSVPLKLLEDGGNPLLQFNVRYKQDKEGAEWKEMQLPSDSVTVSLQDLSYGSDYVLEVSAVNSNGSSIPTIFNFTISGQSGKGSSQSMTKGSVVGIVMVIFLVVFLVVDATCCYTNRCGLLMSIAVKFFGQNVPGLKMLEGDETTNGEVNLKGLPTPIGSVQNDGIQTLSKEAGQLTEVTCDKAPLTKNEKNVHTAHA